MAKHLIIGLGGTGGSVICELRKRILEEYGQIDPQKDDVFIEYLYVDSSKEDLEGIDKEGKHLDAFDKKWQTLGQSVALEDGRTLCIEGIESEKLNNLYRYNNLNGFFTEEDRKDTAKGLDQIIGAGIGGQRRRFGRILFANSIVSDNNFNSRVDARVDDLLQKAKKKGDNIGNVTFHICAGLGGGTGSGTIIDAISQIRKKYPQNTEGQYRICLYLYIPEKQKNLERDKEGYYRPNGYAALSEINAISIGQYTPIDIANTKDIPAEEKRIKNAGFDAAYIYTNRNLVGNQYNLNELPSIVADFLYQKLLAGITARFESNENVGSDAEKDTNGNPTHSRKFLAFGIKRLIYPETEIHEYAAYKFAQTAALQMVFGWSKGARYPIELSYDQIGVSANEIQGPDDRFPMRQTLHLTDNLLSINGVWFDKYQKTAKDSNWTSIKDFWHARVNAIYANAIKEDNRDLWVPYFNQEVGKQYSSYFRGNGVISFYTNCVSDKVYLAQEIINYIGEYLLVEWKLGNRSLAEVSKFIDILIDDCQERYNKYDTIITKYTTSAQKHNKEANELAGRFTKRGWIRDITGLGIETMFKQYVEKLRERYIAQTTKEAYQFAKVLMNEVISQLHDLHSSIETIKTQLLGYIKLCQENADAKCKEGDGGYHSDSEVIKLYSPEDIRNLVDIFIHEEDKQSSYIGILREIITNLATNKHFIDIADNIKNADAIQKILDNQNRLNAKEKITDYTVENKTQKVLDLNVLEKLRHEQDWKSIIERLCKDALILVERDGREVGADEISSSLVQLGLPPFPEDEKFRQEIIDKVKNTFEGIGYKLRDDNVFDTPKGQLVMLTGRTAIPIRYVQSVSELKICYDDFVRDNICMYKLVHTESFKKPLPSLYAKTPEELKEELYSILPLLYCIPGLVEKEINTETGEKNDAVAKKRVNNKWFCYNRLDRQDELASGFVFLGNDIREALAILSKREGDVSLLSDLVDKELCTKIKHNSKKEELTQAIKKFLKDVAKNAYDSDATNKELQAFVKATDKLFENELKMK